MNTAQLTNLIVSIVVAATGATAGKLGINIQDYTKDVEDLLLLAIAGIVWFLGHVIHATPKTISTTTSSDSGGLGSGFKAGLLIALCLPVLMLAGCSVLISS